MTHLWAKTALLPSGWAENVAISFDTKGVITNVRSNSEPVGTHVGILLPSPVNAHSHAFQRAMAGLTETRGPSKSDSFWTWRQLMYRFLDHLTPEQVEAITALVQMEMLEAGYSTNVEFHYLHHQPGGMPYDTLSEMARRVVAAAGQTGIGLTLLPVQYQFGGCDKRTLGPGQIRFGNDPERFAKLSEESRDALTALPSDAKFGVAPHSLRAVAPDDVIHASELSHGGPIHMHLAEQTAEVEEFQDTFRLRPVEWMLENVPLGPEWCLIHCTQMKSRETSQLAQTGAIAGLCPITESSLGDGIFDGVQWRFEGGALAIGSDSNIRISLVEELRTLEYSQRLRDRSRAALAMPEKSTGRVLFEAACEGGALAAGRRSGQIEEGFLADLLALDANDYNLEGHSDDTLLDCYIFAGSDAMVSDVWAAGRHVVKDGQHIARQTIIETYRKAMKPLRDIL